MMIIRYSQGKSNTFLESFLRDREDVKNEDDTNRIKIYTVPTLKQYHVKNILL